MNETNRRSPRFERLSNPPAIHITDRDMEIMRQIQRHRLLRSDHIHLLMSGSRQRILRRLQTLYHNGIVDRPRSQIEYYRSGSSKMVYALGNRGVDLLNGMFRNPAPFIRVSSGNSSIRRMFLEHTLFVADIAVRMEVTCRSSNVRFIRQDEVLVTLPDAIHSKRFPFQWSVTTPYNRTQHRLGVLPDQVFALRKDHSPSTVPTLFIFLEADCGTMPISRKSIERSSVFRKMLAYHESWKQRLHIQHFGFERTCVLFVTKSAERLENMIAANQFFNNGNGSRMFLFADQSSLVCENPLTSPIKNGASETVSLMDIIK